jgi:hypothetical protein
MTGGFLGTLICLERAVALGLWWAYAAPIFSAAAATSLIAGTSTIASALFFTAGLLLGINSLAVIARQAALFTFVLAPGSVCWVVGSLEWMRGAAPEASEWWLAFLVLTIAAERLEMSRLISTSIPGRVLFTAALLIMILGAVRGELAAGEGWLTGIGLLVSTAWLAPHDIATRTVRIAGQPRFTAVALLAGYMWLTVAAILSLPPILRGAPFGHDAVVHAIAIGFVISMIFGHAPIILPAVAGVKVNLRGAAYAPLALLHVSLVLRIWADLVGQVGVRALTGPVTVLAIVLYASVLFLPKKFRGASRPT